MKCSIIIRAYNEERHISRLLTGIGQQTLQDVETILVDSGSTDGTVTAAQQFPVKIVHISPEEFTFGRSLNLGIASAGGEVVVMASAHVYPVYPDWLERLLEPFEDPKVALVYGKQSGDEGSQFSEHEIFRRWYPDAPQPQQSHPFCNNANAAIRRSLWEAHPYDELLPGLEDLAWARWAFEQGYRISYAPSSEVVHVHRETPRGVYNRYRREGMAFKQIYPQEQFHFSDFVRLFSANAFSDLREAGRQHRLTRSWRSILWFRWMQFWGTYQGYRQSGPLTWQLKQAFYYPRQNPPRQETEPRPVEPIHYSDR
ncbi:MAG: glycosyltransferase family 2 protein [Chloroflexi bacterium]|nr:glycosyltransferase family 2 protein [Chloroflexota bacterium]